MSKALDDTAAFVAFALKIVPCADQSPCAVTQETQSNHRNENGTEGLVAQKLQHAGTGFCLSSVDREDTNKRVNQTPRRKTKARRQLEGIGGLNGMGGVRRGYGTALLSVGTFPF